VNLRRAALALAALLLLGWFSREIYDSEFWWHLKTGQFIVERHSLPVPDPFAYTTAMHPPAGAGEAVTRHFNLTHEWLSQVLFYAAYRAGSWPAVVLFRSALLTLFSALVGLLAFRRSGSLPRGIAAALAAAAVAAAFALDRPYLFSFVLLAATLAILDSGRRLWLLPPMFLFWANAHGGFVLGWVAVGAYAAEALWLRWRKGATAAHRRLWIAGAAAVAVSGLNPNGFRIVEVLGAYRGSYLTSTLLEWAPPRLALEDAFTLLLVGAVAAMLLAWRRVRLVDWLLFAAFAAAALTARRNTFLIALWAPVMIAAYVPWKPRLPRFAGAAATVLLALALAAGIARGRFFQLRVAEWRFPTGAADFLLRHHIAGPIFNTYEYGGYLIWRLWPGQRVFIDGRALSESLFRDYGHILYNSDGSDGPNARQLLDRYGVETIVMNSFEYGNGLVYLLAPSLADPSEREWKLVYSEPQSMVFMRRPPPGVAPLAPLAVFDHMETECGVHIEHEPQAPRCARALGQVFMKIGELSRARRWIGAYLAHPHGPDPEAEEAYRRLLAQGQ
jgi:hypothetical protein